MTFFTATQTISQIPHTYTGQATLDLILTNLFAHYEDPSPLSVLGNSDHICVKWRPSDYSRKHHNDKRTFRPMKDHQMRAFGNWIQDHDWSEVLQDGSTQQKADAFYRSLHGAMDSFFPLTTVKLHDNSKPWLSQNIKDIMKQRQSAFASGNIAVYRKLRNKVQREIKKAKVNFYANRVRSLQATDPRKWYQQVKDNDR